MGFNKEIYINQELKSIIECTDVYKKIETLKNLANSEDNNKSEFAIGYLGDMFPNVSGENQIHIIDILLNLTKVNTWAIYRKSINEISNIFMYLPDTLKKHAWNHLHELSFNEDAGLRERIAFNLGYILPFLSIEDQSEAIDDLQRLSRDSQSFIRESSINSYEISIISSFEAESNTFFKNLFQLSDDPDNWIRRDAIYSLTQCFPHNHIYEKAKFYDMLNYRLKINDESVFEPIAYAIGKIYKHSTRGQKFGLWRILIYMLNYSDPDVRERAAYSLGSIYPLLSKRNRSLAVNYLEILADDENKKVKAFSFYSLGKIFIAKSNQAKSRMKFEANLKKAIYYFEHSMNEHDLCNPSKFCFHFYTIFYLLLIDEKRSYNEILSDIKEIKLTQEGKFKNELLAPIESLVNALVEANCINKIAFHDMKRTLKKINDSLDSYEISLTSAAKIAPNIQRVMHFAEEHVKTEIKELLKKSLDEIKDASEEVILLKESLNENSRISDDGLKSKTNRASNNSCNRDIHKYVIDIIRLFILENKNINCVNSSKFYRELDKKIKNVENEITSEYYNNINTGNNKVYEDFFLHISPNGYALASSLDGEVNAEISINPPDNINLALKNINNNNTSASLNKNFGRDLCKWILSDSIYTKFLQAKSVARRSNHGIRIRLQIEAEAIASLPLELLYDDNEGKFMSTNMDLVLSRYLFTDLPNVRIPSEVSVIRILIIIANPKDQMPLNVEEWDSFIKEILYKLYIQRLIEICIVKNATRKEISNAILNHRPHIIQYIGHGFYSKGKAALALVKDDTGETWSLDAEDFANLIDSNNLRLVCLAACESAKSENPQSFIGIAPQLVQRGIPSVVAMQYKIKIKVAKIFLETFYGALSENMPVDWAIQWARNNLSIEFGLNNLEFAAPVLYMRAKDGCIF